jgi:hypothetical protein
MAQTPHHFDGLIDLLVEAVLREIEAENVTTTKKADAGSLSRAPGRPGDFEHGQRQHNPIAEDGNRSSLPPPRQLL